MTAGGMSLRHARGYMMAHKQLLRYLPVSCVGRVAKAAYREYLAQMQIAVFTCRGQRWRAKGYALFQAFRREGWRYAFRRILKYVSSGR